MAIARPTVRFRKREEKGASSEAEYNMRDDDNRGKLTPRFIAGRGVLWGTESVVPSFDSCRVLDHRTIGHQPRGATDPGLHRIAPFGDDAEEHGEVLEAAAVEDPRGGDGVAPPPVPKHRHPPSWSGSGWMIPRRQGWPTLWEGVQGV